MSHKIHTTEALVLGSEPFGEANRWFWLFTPDLGLVRARAQSVRLGQSKLRGHLLLYDHVQISLVRGRDSWLLVGAISTNLVRSALRLNIKRELAAKISRLLIRLLAGEEANIELYNGVLGGFQHLTSAEFEPSALYHYELIMVLRILANLGYIGQQSEFGRLSHFSAGWQEVLEHPTLPETAMLTAINEALRHSHL